MNLLAACTAFFCGATAFRDRRWWQQALAALATFPMVVLVVCQGLGLVGRLTWGAGTLAVGVLAAVTGAVWWKWGRATLSPTFVLGPARASFDPTGRIKLAVSISMLAAFGGVLVLQACLAGTNYGIDDLNYHAPVVAHWLQDEAISLTPVGCTAYYPFNAEILSLWFMLPLHGDAFASLGGLYWTALAAGAVAALVHLLGGSRSSAVLCAAVMPACPVILSSAKSFVAADLAGPAMLLAAFALVAGPRREGCTTTWSEAIYGGLLCGFAVGTKVPFMIPCLLVFLWVTFRPSGTAGVKARAKVAGLFVVFAALTGAFWYVRTAALTGNPLFPAKIGPFDGPFGPHEQARTRLIHWLLNYPGDRQMWVYLANGYSNWPFGLFLLSASGYAWAVRALIRRNKMGNGQYVSLQSLLLVVGAAMLAAYPFIPFSGTYNQPNATLGAEKRFLILQFCIGLVLFSGLLERAATHCWWAIALLALATSWPETNNNLAVFPAILLAGGALLLWQPLGELWTRIPKRGAVVGVLFTAFLAILGWWTPRKQVWSNAKLYEYRSLDNQWPVARGWRGLEQIPAGSRIAWLGPGSYEYYPLFGRSLSLVPRRVKPDGTAYELLHVRWRRDPGGTRWWGQESIGDLDRLVDNLVSQGIQYVLLTQGDAQWPMQQRALAQSPRGTMVYSEDGVMCWRLESRHAPESRPDRLEQGP